jgi:hypothetical protein
MEEPERRNNQNQNQYTRRPGDYSLQKAVHASPFPLPPWISPAQAGSCVCMLDVVFAMQKPQAEK